MDPKVKELPSIKINTNAPAGKNSDKSAAVRPSYMPELDGIRAMSIGFVFLAHNSYGYIAGGFVGVDVFFVLSGFLITLLLLRERTNSGTISFYKFYVRRVLRILPVVVIGLILAGVIWPYVVTTDTGSFEAVAPFVLFFASNFIDNKELGPLGHTWSLAVEEQFYIVWPLVVFAAARFARSMLTVITILTILFSIAARFWGLESGNDPSINYSATLCRMDSLLIGCLLAIHLENLSYWLRGHPFALGMVLYFSAAGLMISVVILSPTIMQTNPLAFSLFALLCAAFIISAVLSDSQHPVRLFLVHPIVRQLGIISYGLYVYHYPIFLFFEQFRIAGNLQNYIYVSLAKVFVSLLLAELSWRIVERPLLGFKKHFSVATIRSYGPDTK